MSTDEQKVFVVLGMARSGTSALARGLKALGIDLGEKLTPASERWNPKGFWEDTDIVYKINRGVLYGLDFSWLSVNKVKQFDNSKLDSLKKYALQLIKKRIAGTTHWGFKDPRTANLLPFWQDIFSTLQLKENYVIALRNPLASAYSYNRVSDVDIEVGLLLWIMHLIQAIDGTHGKKRVMVSYELMLQNPAKQLSRLKSALQLQIPTDHAAIDQYANEFLDKKLSHFEYSDKDLKSHPATSVAPLCINMYALFLKLATDEITFDDPLFLSMWQEIKKEFDIAYPTYCYIDELLKKNKTLERKIRTMNKSLPWKLIYPLRFVDDILRSLRRRLREKRRLLKSY